MDSPPGTETTSLCIRLLGPFEVTLAGQPVTGFETAKARALLAYLATEPDVSHRREALAEMLWPSRPEGAARANLRHALLVLRRAIGDRNTAHTEAESTSALTVTRDEIQFDSDSDAWVDVAAFAQSAAGATQRVRPILSQLEAAASVYRGPFLADLSLRDSAEFEEWALLKRQQLSRQAMNVLYRLAEGYEALGEYARALAYAYRQLELEPWEEGAHRQVMRALALDGQRDAALAQYETCRRALQAELAVEPEEATTELFGRIRDRRELPAPVALPVHNLPAPLTPFVGRQRELAEIAQHLADPSCRLLSLVGPGGSGKTRLALEAATSQLDAYDHGVFFCSLAPLQSAQDIVPTIGQAIGLSFYPGGEPRQQLVDYLRRRRMLLVLDNYEHLLSPHEGERGKRGGAGVAIDILYAAPEVRILATSRAGLNVPGECVFRVGGMAYPDQTSDVCQTSDVLDAARYSAVELFVESARRAQPGFELADDNLADVIRICRLVEGMPLGILLATTWLEMLTSGEVAAEIERGLDFLAADWREVPDRQRSMRAVFDHSWRLLSDQQRQVLCALSVFRGGCTRRAAQEVSGASLRELMSLVNQSLLHRTGERYEMHELLRQYVADELARAPDGGVAVRDRHSAYFTAAIAQWEVDLKGSRQLMALAEMDAETENMRAAWDWAVKRGHVEQLDRAVFALWCYASIRSQGARYALLFRKAAQALSKTGATGEPCPDSDAQEIRVLAKMLAAEAGFCNRASNTPLARQSLALLERGELQDRDVRAEKAFALLVAGWAWCAKWAIEQSLALYRDLDDPWGTGQALGTLVNGTPWTPANYGRVQRLAQEVLSIGEAQGDQFAAGSATHGLAEFALQQGLLDRAERLGLQALDRFQRVGVWVRVSWVYDLLSTVAMARGQFDRACTQMKRGADLNSELGVTEGIIQADYLLGTHRMHLGQYAQARHLGERALELWGKYEPTSMGLLPFRYEPLQMGALLLLGSVALVEGAYARTRELLKGRDLTAYRIEAGRHMLDHAPSILACALCGLGQRGQARKYLSDALRLVPDARAFWPLLYALSVYALLLVDEGETERAVELYALASRYPFVANSRWFEDVAGEQVAAAAEALPADVVQAAQERGRARDLEATVRELLLELGEANSDH